jgi:5-methylcytosine-specific restriction endonuclease McrA
MRGMEYLMDRPRCDFPELVKIKRWARPDAWDRSQERAERRRRINDRRSSMDKTGQATRLRQREQIILVYGPICHICVANGVTDHRSVIDLTLPWPDLRCFTRDHVIPRSKGGTDHISNLRPAHHQCNRDRGDGPIVFARAA